MLYKNYKIVGLITALVVLSSCELERIPEGDLSDKVYWKSDSDFREGTNYLYKAIQLPVNDEEAYPLFSDVTTDNAVANGGNDVANGSYLPSSDFGPWDQDYIVIRAANNIIQQAELEQPESAARFMAEARFFRAYAYADLLRRYGGVPLIMKTLAVEDEELYSPRASREEVIQAIYGDLDYATANLPLDSELNNGNEYGMVTKGAALTLKGRVALREGTWNKFHNAGDAAGHLQVAKASALSVMQSAEYELFDLGDPVESYKQLFKGPGQGPDNKEVIWAYTYGINKVDRIQPTTFAANVSNGNMGVSKALVDAYLCTDGLPIELSPLYEGRDSVSSEFVNRDHRLNGTVVKKGDIYLTKLPYAPSLISLTGYPMNKYFEFDGNAIDGNLDLILMRYGELLLTYAEATFELNEAISDADLDLSINLLRIRAGIAPLTNAFVSGNGLEMRNEIRRERRTELGLEGFRYDDLLRWKTAETEMPKALVGAKVFPEEYVGVDVADLNLDPDGHVIVEPATKRNFDPAKHYLWPLPLEQLGLNPAMDQNPNW